MTPTTQRPPAGKIQTLGFNCDAATAAAIRRAANRSKSISAVLWSLIDRRKLDTLLANTPEESTPGGRNYSLN